MYCLLQSACTASNCNRTADQAARRACFPILQECGIEVHRKNIVDLELAAWVWSVDNVIVLKPIG